MTDIKPFSAEEIQALRARYTYKRCTNIVPHSVWHYDGGKPCTKIWLHKGKCRHITDDYRPMRWLATLDALVPKTETIEVEKTGTPDPRSGSEIEGGGFLKFGENESPLTPQ
jgi:hypothetical protein